MLTGGISLLSMLSKVHLEVLLRRLNDWIETRGFISECQMGIRKGRRTVDKIFILRTTTDKHLLWNRCVI
jgi:hypothetical protein